ncbi:MAG: sialate O-acetylesterase [Ignavibacteriales bacterium]|nr:MAG: sialate O-acetylesterase [Ignavibacteriales bacterium]
MLFLRKNIYLLLLSFLITVFNAECFCQPDVKKNPCPIDADIWILAGQSQMAGAGRTPDTTSNPNIWMLNMDGNWMVAKNPLHRIFEATAQAFEKDFFELLPDSMKDWDKAHAQFQMLAQLSKTNPVGGVGPGLYFAMHILEQTGRPVALIPCALGGSKMEMWYPEKRTEGNNSLYGAMLNKINSVNKEKIKGFIWSQGESEAMMLKTGNYEKDLLRLIESVRKDVGKPDLPVILIQAGRFITVNPAMDKTWEELREIQRKVTAESKNVYMTSGIDLPLDDCAHISTDGQKRLGKRLAEIALTYVYNQPGHAKQISLESIKMCKDEKSSSNYLHLHYSGVCGRLSACCRPSQFSLRINGEARIEYVVSKVEFDPNDDAGINIYLSGVPNQPATLICGDGVNPYMNITDSLDNPVPAFGPIDIPLE